MTAAGTDRAPAPLTRPADRAVWKARLRWGIAANRLDTIQEAQKHLPASDATLAEVQGKKTEIERMRTRYRELYERTQHVRDAEEMAHLAQQLGRPFEARVFLTLAISQEPDREDLRHDFERLSQSEGKHPRTR